ncbi:hypothetical protein ACWKX9_26520, partial [Enterobacter asburiae]
VSLLRSANSLYEAGVGTMLRAAHEGGAAGVGRTAASGMRAAAVLGAKVATAAGNRLFQSSASGTQVSIDRLGVGSSCLRVPQEDIELTEVARASGSASADLPAVTWKKGLGMDINGDGTMNPVAQFTNNFMNTGEPGLVVHGGSSGNISLGNARSGLKRTMVPSTIISHLKGRGIELEQNSTLHMAACKGASTDLYGRFAAEAKVNVLGYGGQGKSVYTAKDTFTHFIVGVYDDAELTIPINPILYRWKDYIRWYGEGLLPGGEDW